MDEGVRGEKPEEREDNEVSNEHLEALFDGAQKANSDRAKAVIRSDGKVFGSITDAASDANVTRRAITDAIEHGWRAGGYRYMFLEEGAA